MSIRELLTRHNIELQELLVTQQREIYNVLCPTEKEKIDVSNFTKVNLEPKKDISNLTEEEYKDQCKPLVIPRLVHEKPVKAPKKQVVLTNEELEVLKRYEMALVGDFYQSGFEFTSKNNMELCVVQVNGKNIPPTDRNENTVFISVEDPEYTGDWSLEFESSTISGDGQWYPSESCMIIDVIGVGKYEL